MSMRLSRSEEGDFQFVVCQRSASLTPLRKDYAIQKICLLAVIGFLALASRGDAQNTMELTGLGDYAYTNSGGGTYLSPYQGSIWSGVYTGSGYNNAPSGAPDVYSGYIICDDLTDTANLDSYWNATATNAASVNASDLFYDSGTGPDTGFAMGYTAQNDYNAIAWLANQLLLPLNISNVTEQAEYSFAIWDIMDGAMTDPDPTDPEGDVATLVADAYSAVNGGYQGTNVTVYSPSPNLGVGSNVSQEFLVVSTPEASTPVLLAVDLLGFVALFGFLRKRLLQRA